MKKEIVLIYIYTRKMPFIKFNHRWNFIALRDMNQINFVLFSDYSNKQIKNFF